ncbi:MAG: condensation domain-containing protein [Chthoniobacterales bacterium]
MIRRRPSSTPVVSPNESTPRLKVAEASVPSPTPAEDFVYNFPATLAQRRFWLLDKLHPGGNPALNLPIALRVRGLLFLPSLREAWQRLVNCHEALRTVFTSERGELRQLIAPTLLAPLPLEECETSAEDGWDARLLRAEAHRPFDLEAGPLARARLVRLGAEDHLLLLTLHHIITDGWSNGLLARELCQAYSALVRKETPVWPELPVQFADYAAWQAERLEANDFAWQRKYWRHQLAGDLPVLDLPTDRPRLKSQNAAADLCAHVLPPELVAAARALASSEDSSPFMLFLAVFQVLLHRYSGQEDFLITTPSANRQRPELEALVGPFVNPLLLRADLRDDPTFSELLARVRSVALDGFMNQDVPFELLLDEFQPRQLQVNFLYQSAFLERTELAGGASVEPVHYVSPGTVHELSAAIFEEADGVRLEFEYDTALFDRTTIERMLGHYETLLARALADPAQRISQLPLLTSSEIRPLNSLGEERETALDVRAPLIARVMERPDTMVARHGKREMSCAELLARMENARNSDRGARPPSDLDQGANWIAHWRVRLDPPPPAIDARTPPGEGIIAANSLALRDFLQAQPGERIASFTQPGAAATEELGAAILAGALLVYPTPDLYGETPAATASWLERENITIAFLPAATWNRIMVNLGRKLSLPPKLRLVIATEGEREEGGFGRVFPAPELSGVRVCARVVNDSANGTLSLCGENFPATAFLQVVDSRSHQPLPAGVPGELALALPGHAPEALGELARWLPNDTLDLLGPKDAQQFARGFRVDPRATEDVLRALPGVRNVLLRPHATDGDTVFVAYVLLDPTVTPAPDDPAYRRLLREQNLPDHAIPAAFVRVKDIPVRALDGRVDFYALPVVSELPATSEPVRPYLGLQLQLIAIWEEVLGVRGIGIRDDFFDLGGNSLLAMRMLQRAEIACGTMIAPTALFKNPTIEHLAGVLAREVIQDAPALLRVHDTGKCTPFFYLHGDLSGGGFYSLKLSRALGRDQPFFVMPPQDVRHLTKSPSVEEMAAQHLQTMLAVRPRGPYVIGGFCAAGLIAYELAQQLRARGEEVEMLIMIDAAPDDHILRAAHSLSLILGRLFRWSEEAKAAHFERWVLRRARLELMGQLSLGAQARLVGERMLRPLAALRRTRADKEREAAETVPALEANLDERDVAPMFLWAAAQYRPKPYESVVALLLSEDVLCSADNVARSWKQLAPNVTVHPLNGSHLECITAHVDTLAQTIQRCLGNAPVEKRSTRG